MGNLANISDLSWVRLFALILPGFIALRVYSFVHPTERKPLKDVILDAIAYSVLNAALLWWFVQYFVFPAIKDRVFGLYFSSLYLRQQSGRSF